jgi:hypothetical protein
LPRKGLSAPLLKRNNRLGEEELLLLLLLLLLLQLGRMLPSPLMSKKRKPQVGTEEEGVLLVPQEMRKGLDTQHIAAIRGMIVVACTRHHGSKDLLQQGEEQQEEVTAARKQNSSIFPTTGWRS